MFNHPEGLRASTADRIENLIIFQPPPLHLLQYLGQVWRQTPENISTVGENIYEDFFILHENI